MKYKTKAIAMACSLAFLSMAPLGVVHGETLHADRASRSSQFSEAQEDIDRATRVAERMTADPQLKTLVQQAKGIFILPHYGRAGLVVGAQGGEGVMLAHHLDGEWSAPVFFNVGGISLGAQAGAEGGPIAMLLMSDKAVDNFKRGNNFSLNAAAGLTIIHYSADAQANAGAGDVIVWSDTKGAFAGATVGVTDIRRDKDENRALYGRTMTTEDVLAGRLTTRLAKPLHDALSGGNANAS